MTTESEGAPTPENKVSWRSPSNIALIKYWGKKPIQIPANASISFTLSEAHSETSVAFSPRNSDQKWIQFLFEGQDEPTFASRIERFLNSLKEEMPFLSDYNFKIESSNSFPHSSGIASSASSMSALSLCLCDIENQVLGKKERNEHWYNRASHIARLGSGSASRSVLPRIAVWGQSPHIPHSSDQYAIAYNTVNPIFHTFHDDVLIVSKEKKSVSSSQGHALMDGNIYASSRYQQADRNMSYILDFMQEGDLMAFGKVVEDEALSLHALMMCSDPSFILMKPNTLNVIEKIRAYRASTGHPIFFTLDAGPNVHILYPDSIQSEVDQFIKNELLAFAEDGKVIKDQVGDGPIKLL